MHSFVGARLSIMMFIQFFIWGAWYVTAPRVLGPMAGFGGADYGWTYSVGPIAGMISPFFVGMVADRLFSLERVMGVLHLAAAGAMFAVITMVKGDTATPGQINFLLFVHMLCYFPTLALVNSISMQNITSSEKQFPLIRVFGTIGWIVAGLALGRMGWNASIHMFDMAAWAGVIMGLYCFSLPHTPPPGKGKRFTVRDAVGADAWVLLQRPSFAVFMLSSFLICIPLAFYYQLAERTVTAAEITGSVSGATGGLIGSPVEIMTLGQMSEILFMILMPLFFAALGVKWMLFVGMLAWVARYGLFAMGVPDEVAWMIVLGVALHGICYDFFFVTGQIYTDKSAPIVIRSQAQGMLVLFTLGLGMFIGAQIAGRVEGYYTPAQTAQLNEAAGAIGKQVEQLQVQLAAAPEAAKPALQEQIDKLTAEQQATAVKALKAMDWKSIWLIPCIAAAAVMVFFALVFRDDTKPSEHLVDQHDLADAAAKEEQP